MTMLYSKAIALQAGLQDGLKICILAIMPACFMGPAWCTVADVVVYQALEQELLIFWFHAKALSLVAALGD